jgi:hypothetical protein
MEVFKKTFLSRGTKFPLLSTFPIISFLAEGSTEGSEKKWEEKWWRATSSPLVMHHLTERKKKER